MFDSKKYCNKTPPLAIVILPAQTLNYFIIGNIKTFILNGAQYAMPT